LIDDTQAFGILGRSPSAAMPYGLAGGGTLRWLGVTDANVVLLTSLAKAFGAPLALLSGSTGAIERFEALSETRRHCSPPSLAALRAAARALEMNAAQGDELRARLHVLVRQFRDGLQAQGWPATGGCFPVQTLPQVPGVDPQGLHDRLRRLGVRALLQERRGGQGACITFLITASHTPEAIAGCLEALGKVRRRAPRRKVQEVTRRR
jgi:8-amino-7-oxononanoate synthase